MYELKARVEKLLADYQSISSSLNLDKMKTRLGELDSQATDPDLWNDSDNARKILQEASNLKKEIDEMSEIYQSILTLVGLEKDGALTPDFLTEIEGVEDSLKKLELKSFLSGTYDNRNAVISIHSGQGGTEAMDWADMLYRMYMRFCERRGWKTKVIDYSAGEEAGVKSVAFKVEGLFAYGYLKTEVGTHRLVRQSPFNADNLRQTSFALVEVLPELADVDLPDIVVKDSDLEIQFFRASSQGGQNVQKVSTAVRLRHIPTGIVVTAQAERFQEQNRKNALSLLKTKIWALEQEKAKAQVNQIKGEYKPASWGTQIRSYVLHPYKMVKDLRTNVETGNTDAVLDGDLDNFVEAQIRLLPS